MLNPSIIQLVKDRVSGITNNTVDVPLAPGQNVFAGLENYDSLLFLIQFTNGGAVTGNVNVYIQDSWNNGQTWDDLVASGTFALGGGVGAQRFGVEGLQPIGTITGAAFTALTQGSGPQQEALAAGSIRQGPFGDRIRVREKVSGVAGSPVGATYSIWMVPCRSALR